MGDTSVKPPSPAPVMTHDMPGPGGSTVRQQQHHQRMLKAMEAQYAKLDDLNNRCETPSRPLQYMMERMKEHIDSLKQNGEASGIRPEQGQLKEKFKGPSL
jgi:cell division septum initiation protein DivIVA